MSDEETGESLAAAVADHASIDWRESERLTGADAELVRQFRIISAIGAKSREAVVADHSRSARALFGLSIVVTTITLAKLALTAVGFVVYLVTLQAFVIDAWCIWCLVNDLVLVPLLAVLTVWRVRLASD